MEEELSDCCQAPVKMEGGADDFYSKNTICTMCNVCTKCGEACDIKPKEEKENE